MAQAQQEIQPALVFCHTHCCSRGVGSRDLPNGFSTILVVHSENIKWWWKASYLYLNKLRSSVQNDCPLAAGKKTFFGWGGVKLRFSSEIVHDALSLQKVHTALLLALARILAWTLFDYLLTSIPSSDKVLPFDCCPKIQQSVARIWHVTAALPARASDNQQWKISSEDTIHLQICGILGEAGNHKIQSQCPSGQKRKG